MQNISNIVTILGREYDIAQTTSMSLDYTDIRPLADLTDLRDLHLNDNKLGEEDLEWLKTQLPIVK